MKGLADRPESLVNGFGDLVLAGAGLAGDQYRSFGMGHQGDEFEHLAHFRALADNRLRNIALVAKTCGIDHLGKIVEDDDQSHQLLAVILQRRNGKAHGYLATIPADDIAFDDLRIPAGKHVTEGTSPSGYVGTQDKIDIYTPDIGQQHAGERFKGLVDGHNLALPINNRDTVWNGIEQSGNRHLRKNLSEGVVHRQVRI